MTSHLCLVQCFPRWLLELLKTTCESRSKTEESVNSKVAGMVTCVWFAFPFGDQESMSESTAPPSLQALPHLSGCPWAREKLNSTLNSKLVLRVKKREGGGKLWGEESGVFPQYLRPSLEAMSPGPQSPLDSPEGLRQKKRITRKPQEKETLPLCKGA